MESTPCLFLTETRGNLSNRGSNRFAGIEFCLQAHLTYPWIVVKEDKGINVLLLSRTEEKSVQRRAYFSYSGDEKISVHSKPISRAISDVILQQESNNVPPNGDTMGVFVKRIITVVKRLQSYEVCVGVDDDIYKPLWDLDKSGEVDHNYCGELRYKHTFRPFQCHLFVSTDGHLRRRCSFCIKTKMRFTAKMSRHRTDFAKPSTPNVHLDRNQLLNKVVVQKNKLKYRQALIKKRKIELRNITSQRGLDDSLSEEILKVCMAYVTYES